MLEWLGLPDAASADAARIDRIVVLVHWLMVVLFVGWGLFFAFVLVKFRRGAHPRARHEGVRGRSATTVELAVLAAEVVLLAFFSIPAWSARVDSFPTERGSTVVRVIAEQFAWNVHYPGADGRFGRTDLALVSPENPIGLDRRDAAARDDVTTVNQLHVPIDTPVIVYLSSKDVIHSFTLPQMRVKQDAIPGTVQPVWFTPTQAGQWEIACSQLCGLAHYRLRGLFTFF
jgi:cytochrome c oxidase subunit 2